MSGTETIKNLGDLKLWPSNSNDKHPVLKNFWDKISGLACNRLVKNSKIRDIKIVFFMK